MRLTDYLAETKLGDAEFARRIAVSPQALSRYKLGQRRPEWDVLERIHRATDGRVTPNDFMPTPAAEAVVAQH